MMAPLAPEMSPPLPASSSQQAERLESEREGPELQLSPLALLWGEQPLDEQAERVPLARAQGSRAQCSALRREAPVEAAELVQQRRGLLRWLPQVQPSPPAHRGACEESRQIPSGRSSRCPRRRIAS